MERMEAHRQFFSRLITASAGIAKPDHPLTAAFAAVRREDFVGAGPWEVFTPSGYIRTPSADPAFLYQDITVALDTTRQLNNGQPLLHAASLAALAVRTGEVVLHIGAGTGYYSALLAALTGKSGKVIAYEIVPELASKAAENLGDLENVSVVSVSGVVGPFPACDAIYVNAGATGPADAWLDALNVGGRLLFPLTPAEIAGRLAPGMMLLITREAERDFQARFVCSAAFTPCIGARDQVIAARLTASFARGDARTVRSLRRDGKPDASCWCEGDHWWLSRN